MPFDYDRDDARRRLVITYRGEFQVTEVLETLARVRTDEAWTYTVLYDLRAMTGRPDLDDLKKIVDARDPLRRRTPFQRGPVALLVGNMEMYATACAYAELAKPMLAIEVFRYRDEADLWLGAHGGARDGA